jgi:hypothetical protein
MNFIGRETELSLLRSWDGARSRLTVIYGRRRVGKTRLVEEAFRGKKCFRFEGIENETRRESMQTFLRQLAGQFDSPELLELNARRWDVLLSILSRKLGPEPCVMVFDEFQWIAGRYGNLGGHLKYAWDNLFVKNNRVHLILCGSISSFMVKKVIRSKALYGRVDCELALQPLLLPEIIKGADIRRSAAELIEMYMLTGGVPHYIQLFDWKHSAWLNIRNLCFTANGFLVKEFERIFASHFGTIAHYGNILKALARRKNATREQLQKACSIETGGRISEYLENLELAGFIEKFTGIDRPEGVRYSRYRLADFYLLFYFTFIAPNLKKILNAPRGTPLEQYLPDRLKYPWMGRAFEHLCIHHHHFIAGHLGFGAVNYRAGSWASKEDDGSGAQIDLAFVRADKVITICEIKYTQDKTGPEIIADMERKVAAFPNKKKFTVEKVLITSAGATDALASTGYFHRILTTEALFSGSR